MWSIKTEGFPQLDADLVKLGKQSEQPIKEWDLAEPLYQDFLEVHEDRWRNAGYGEWPENSQGYAEAKAEATGFGSFVSLQLMILTGDLRDSMTKKGAKGAIFEENPNGREVTFGSAIPYAKSHMTRRGRRPARPPLGQREQDLRRYRATIKKYARAHTAKLKSFTQTDIGTFD